MTFPTIHVRALLTGLLAAAFALSFAPTSALADGGSGYCSSTELGTDINLNGAGLDLPLASGETLELTANTSVQTSVTLNSSEPFKANGTPAKKVATNWYRHSVTIWIGAAAAVTPYLNLNGASINREHVVYTGCVS